MMSVLGWIVFGFVVGLIARALMPGKDSIGLIGTTFLGVVGALLGGWLGQAFGWYAPGEGKSFIAALAGSVLLLFLYRLTGARRIAHRSEHPGGRKAA